MDNHIIAEYIWFDGDGGLRSKARTITQKNIVFKVHELTPSDLPDWNYDGSSTKQARGDDSEVIIKPCSIFRCPFRTNSHNILVMCDTYKPSGEPLHGNNRIWAKEIFDKNLEQIPWYGIEQEYFMIDNTTGSVLGFEQHREPPHQGQYYCSAGAGNTYGRALADEHYEACLVAGLSISGVNAEVAPGQWEYQIGPVEGIAAGDQLYIARYILQRLGEKHKISINIEPKPLYGDWNGSGCHTNFSTKNMRDDDGQQTGLDNINKAIEKLSLKHDEHMRLYGSDNHLRMTGEHETSSFDKFSSGVANRGASIRIPNQTSQDGYGYFEDRRPSSNMDPYLVTGIIFSTINS